MGGGMCGGMCGGMGGSEAMFRAALQGNMGGTVMSQLSLLLPAELLSKSLVPHGHMAEIAQRCGIRIDLGDKVPPDMCQVGFTGSVVANAMAAYFLQERALQYMGVGPIGGA